MTRRFPDRTGVMNVWDTLDLSERALWPLLVFFSSYTTYRQPYNRSGLERPFECTNSAKPSRKLRVTIHNSDATLDGYGGASLAAGIP